LEEKEYPMKNYIGSAVFALSALTAHAGYQEVPAPAQAPCTEQDKCEQGQQAPAPEQAPAQAAPAPQQAPGAQQAPCAEQDKACEQGQQAPTEQVVVVEEKASCQEGKLVELRDVNHKFAAKSVESAVIRTNLDGTMSLLLEVKVKSGPLGIFTRTENHRIDQSEQQNSNNCYKLRY
jgi:hypothetical protein